MSSVNAEIRHLEHFKNVVERYPATDGGKAVKQMIPEMVAQTPFETGRLESSVNAVLTVDGKGKTTITARASAVDPDTHFQYAGFQHENPQLHHPVKGKAYYIRDPFMMAIDDMTQDIERTFERELSK